MKYSKRRMLAGIIALILVAVATVSAFSGCSSGRLFPKNVFDHIGKELQDAKWGHFYGEESVLLTGTDDAFIDQDLGQFMALVIPELKVSISEYEDGLKFFFTEPELEDCVDFLYDEKRGVLMSNERLEYFIDNFLVYYLEWCDASGEKIKYSLNDLGEYTYEKKESPFFTAWYE